MKRIAVCLLLAATAACSTPSTDDTGSTSQHLADQLPDPDGWNTDLLSSGWDDQTQQNRPTTVGYGQTLAGIQGQRVTNCTNFTDGHDRLVAPDAPYFYCAVAIDVKELDQITVTVTNQDNPGTMDVVAYLVGPTYFTDNFDGRTLASDHFVGDHNGNNTNAPITLSLTPKSQLPAGTYYAVFAKFAVRDNNSNNPSDYFSAAKWASGDQSSVRVDAITADQLPLSLDKPPVRSGIYTSLNGSYFIDVDAPPAASAKDMSAWKAHVYKERSGCDGVGGSLADYSGVVCGSTACGFYDGTRDGGMVTGLWLVPQTPTTVSYSSADAGTLTLTWGGPVDETLRAAYENQQACKVTCPSTPQPGQPQDPCGSSGSPGWCSPDWQPPFGFESPLVFNLSGDTTIGWLGSGVSFNLDGNGAHPSDWVAPAFPFLALDLNGNGTVDDGTELFGTATKIGAANASDGFAALAQYDGNNDGKIDASDAVYPNLLLWFDQNSDGVSQPSELSPLAFSGIDAISLNKVPAQAPTSTAGAYITFTSTFDEHVCTPPSSMFVADVWFPTTPR